MSVSTTHSIFDLGLLRSGELSDATIICKDRTFAVHRSILCSRSEWFRAALNGPFVLSLKDAPRFNSIFVAYCQAYELGDYFRLPLLTAGVAKALSEQPGPSSSDLQYTTDPLFTGQLTAEYTYAFFDGVARAYTNNSPAFRPLQRAFVEHTLRQRHILLADPCFTECLEDEPCFAKDVLLELLKERYGDSGSRLAMPEQAPDTGQEDVRDLLPEWDSAPFPTSKNGAPWQAGSPLSMGTQ
ncbi:hypothetical protein DL765_010047 [Monosporascus sp. GIB2]|nr:hypothetical protein DL765_010047 [Monosporascus sp. GIB2]